MTDSMYLIIESVKEAKKLFKPFVGDADTALELVGEKESKHITVSEFGRTDDDQFIIEIPRTLKGLQDKILVSSYAGKLKTKAEIQKLTKKPEFMNVVE